MGRKRRDEKRAAARFAAKLIVVALAAALAAAKGTWPEIGRRLFAGASYVAADAAVTTANGGVPSFTQSELEGDGRIRLSELDALGRCGPAFMIVGPATMPTEERGRIGSVKPSGWKSVKYPGVIPDKFLYNRCHLLGYQLSGLNAEERNLITGTRYFNATLMLKYEDAVADYVERTGRRVAYRVTPDFRGDELVARGVTMEAESVEDGGSGLSFAVYVPNVQPGIEIDYRDGSSRAAETGEQGTERL